MTWDWCSFIIGVLIGEFVGIIGVSLAVIARERDHELRETSSQQRSN